MNDEWMYRGEVGVAAATVGFWDRASLPADHRFVVATADPEPPTAVVCIVGDDIDGGVETNPDGDVVRVRVVFVDDADADDGSWTPAGDLHVPTGTLVITDPYCTPAPPYRRELDVRPGLWHVDTTDDGGLVAARLQWISHLPG